MSTALNRLEASIQDFRIWAERYPVAERFGEWECDYGDWHRITSAFEDYLDAFGPDQWDEAVIALLLYALARDNETESLKNELLRKPLHLMALARAGVDSTEAQAKWQLADALGSPKFSDGDVEALLARYFEDEDEYVSRRALLALGRRQSPLAENLAQRAWETGLEYQRMAALDVLYSVGSPMLSSYLSKAREDGREYLASFAQELLKKTAD